MDKVYKININPWEQDVAHTLFPIGGFEVIGDKGLVLGQFFGKRAQKVGKSVDFEYISKQRLAMQESFFVSTNIALCVIKKAIFCDDLRSDVKSSKA